MTALLLFLISALYSVVFLRYQPSTFGFLLFFCTLNDFNKWTAYRESSCLCLDSAVFVVDFFPCFYDFSVALATIVVFLKACRAKMFL